MCQQIRSRRPIEAPTGAFPPNKSAGLSARSRVTSQVHETFLRAFFCPSRESSQCFSQASGASRSQHRLSSFLLTKYGSRGCSALGCANTNEHRPTNTRSSFSAPEAVLSEVTSLKYKKGQDLRVNYAKNDTALRNVQIRTFGARRITRKSRQHYHA